MKRCINCDNIIAEYDLVCRACNTPTEMTLSKIVESAKAGIEEAFNALMKNSENTLFILARQYTNNDADALDIVQNSFIKAYRNLAQCEPDKYIGWMKTIVKNTALDFVRSADQKYNVSFTDIERTNDEGETEEFDIVDESIDSNPQMYMDTNSRKELLFEIYDALPDKQRIVLLKAYYEDMKIKDIAEELDINENTVKTLLKRAKESVKEAVELLSKRDGIKLYNFAPFSFFLWLLKGFKTEGITGNEFLETSVSDEVMSKLFRKTVTDTVNKQTGKAVSRKAAKIVTEQAGKKAAGGLMASMGAKIAAGVLVAGLTVGGGALIMNNISSSSVNPETVGSEVNDVINETEQSPVSEINFFNGEYQIDITNGKTFAEIYNEILSVSGSKYVNTEYDGVLTLIYGDSYYDEVSAWINNTSWLNEKEFEAMDRGYRFSTTVGSMQHSVENPSHILMVSASEEDTVVSYEIFSADTFKIEFTVAKDGTVKSVAFEGYSIEKTDDLQVSKHISGTIDSEGKIEISLDEWDYTHDSDGNLVVDDKSEISEELDLFYEALKLCDWDMAVADLHTAYESVPEIMDRTINVSAVEKLFRDTGESAKTVKQ